MRCAVSSWSTTTRPRSSRRCVDPSTGYRWPSSSPPPGCGRCRCATSRDASTTGSPCFRTPAVAGRNAGVPSQARSGGATTCCSLTTNAACGPCPASRAAHRWRPWSTCWWPSRSPPGAVVDTVTRLVDRSLVSVDSTDDGQVRYRLLDSIRAYAADRLTDAGLAEAAVAPTPAGPRRLPPVRGPRPGQAPAGVSGDRASREGERGRRAQMVPDQRTRPRCQHRDRVRLDLGRPRRRHGRRHQDPRHAHVGHATVRAGLGAPARRLARGVSRRRRSRPR